MENITLKMCEELIEMIDEEMRAFDCGQTEDYDYERSLFVKKLSEEVQEFIGLKELSFSDMSEGMNIKDAYGLNGRILSCDDIHEVYIEFSDGEKRLFCLDENCSDRDFVSFFKTER